MSPNEQVNRPHRGGVADHGRVIRVSAADTGSSGCPQALAIKARPGAGRLSRRPYALQNFTLGPLMTALDRVEFKRHDDETVIRELVRL